MENKLRKADFNENLYVNIFLKITQGSKNKLFFKVKKVKETHR